MVPDPAFLNLSEIFKSTRCMSMPLGANLKWLVYFTVLRSRSPAPAGAGLKVRTRHR